MAFQNKSPRPHQVFDVEGQRFKGQAAGVAQLVGENGPLCDDQPACQRHWLSSAWDSSHTLINNASIDERSGYRSYVTSGPQAERRQHDERKTAEQKERRHGDEENLQRGQPASHAANKSISY